MRGNNSAEHPPVPDLSRTILAGGGELGAMIRGFDWSTTPLGPVTEWPQSVRSVVSMLLPSKAQIILFWGPEFTVLYNDAYRPVFGAKHPHALGRPGRDAWSEIWSEVLHELLAGVVRSGEAFWAEDLLFILERNGFAEETYFDVSYDPVRIESGEVGGVYCIVTETTERVVSARRMALLRDLGAQPTLARTTDEACRLGIDTIAKHTEDVRFALVYLNGLLVAATPEAEAKLVQAPASELFELGIPAPTLSGPAGRLVFGLNPRRPFDAANRTFLNLIANHFGTAIAGAGAYEEETRRAEALAEIDRAKTIFFSNVSHEFRTPLTLILGPLVDLLQDAATPPAQRETLELMQRNGARLRKLVDALLDFSRIEAGRVQPSVEPTDLAALTAELASAFRPAIERAGIELVVQCAPLRRPVYLDRDMWEKIVLNLLSNAFKYTLEGRIIVTIAESDGLAVLTVADTGIGIPERDLTRIFERFHRVEGSHGRTFEGSGIGLALVKELVRIQGGTITVESAVGVGSTFRVSLPLPDEAEPAAGWRSDRAGEPGTVDPNPYLDEALGWVPSGPDLGPAAGPAAAVPWVVDSAGPSGRRRRVLVADDNTDMRGYLERILRARYEVESVGDGMAALDAARRRRPDLILSDVMMPRLDGVSLLREARQDAALRTIPFLLISARAGEEARVEGWAARPDDYLVKPFSAKELMARVAAHLEMAEVRREAELAIRRSEERFRALTNATSDIIYRMSPDWREMRYLEGREVITDTIEPRRGWLDTYIRPDDHVVVQAAIDQAVGAQIPFELEHRVIRIDGSTGWTHSRAIPVFDASGEIEEWFGAATDITKRKDQEERLREADRRKDEFLATLAHELRNPLAPVRTGLEVMRLGGGTPDGIERIRGMMERQVGHMIRLIDDLLDVSRITSGKIALQRQPTPLSTLVEGAVEATRALIAERRIEFSVQVPYSGCVLDVDRTRFVQILSNLLNNAAKFTPVGGRIDLAARVEPAGGLGSELWLTVRDTGIGISAEALPRVFELFAQDEGVGSASRGGLGIGLTLVRRLLELHGGTVEARSEGRGHGTEFTIRMPLSSRVAPDAPSTAVPRSAAGRRVLVIDDNEDAADMLGLLVTELGGDSRVAHDGASGIAFVQAFRPDVVLLDIGMPGLDGYETCRRLRALPGGDQLTIAALTGWGQEGDKQRAVEAGFDLHLTKPADPAMVSRILSWPRGRLATGGS